MEIQKGHIMIKSRRNKHFIFKPYSFFGGGFRTIPTNEIIAYQLSQVFGLTVVPKTEEQNISLILGGNQVFLTGAIQTYIENGIPLTVYGGAIIPKFATQIVLLDTILGNTDRKPDNIIVDVLDRAWAVDNGFCLSFHLQPEINERNENTWNNDYYWNLGLFDLENTELGISEDLIKYVDQEYLYDMVKRIQNTQYNFDFSQIDIFSDEDQKELRAALLHRIKYLPKLVGDQIEEGRIKLHERDTSF